MRVGSKQIKPPEIALALAMLGGFILLSYSLIKPFMALRTLPVPASGLFLVPSSMRQCVNNEQSWAATIADPENSSMECLRKGTPCDTFAIQTPNNYIKLKGSMGPDDDCFQHFNTRPGANTDGFNKSGVVCSAFSERGNDNCPYRFNVSWTATCPDGERMCQNPIVRVNGDMIVGSQDKTHGNAVELQRFALRIARGRSGQGNYFVLSETRPGASHP